MAKRSRAAEPEPDDIDLLNAHRYPEGAAPGVQAHLRNSKVSQKRLEELLKALPVRRGGRVRMEPSAETGGQPETAATPAQGMWQRIRRALSL